MEDFARFLGMPITHDDMNYIEHRTYHDYISAIDYNIKDPNFDPDFWRKTWMPYE